MIGQVEEALLHTLGSVMNDWLEKEKLPLTGWVLVLTPAAPLYGSPWSRLAAPLSSEAPVCREKLLFPLIFLLIYTFKSFLFAYLQFLFLSVSLS